MNSLLSPKDEDLVFNFNEIFLLNFFFKARLLKCQFALSIGDRNTII